MLQAIAATMTGDWAAGSRLATEAMSSLGVASATDPLGRFGWNLVARDVALSECWDDARPQLEWVRLQLGPDPERRLAYEGTRALGEVLAGRPVDALRIAAGVWDIAAVNSMTILRAELTSPWHSHTASSATALAPSPSWPPWPRRGPDR